MGAHKLDISAEDYYRDTFGPVPNLHYSSAATIIKQSAQHAHDLHPRLGGRSRVPSAEMELGTLIHALVLDGGRGVVEVEADDWRSKAVQERRVEIRKAGQIPVLTVKLQQARAISARFHAKIRDYGLSLAGDSEVSVAWEEESDYGPVSCLSRWDHVLWDRATIIDLKTTSGGAHPEICARRIWESCYDIQDAAYRSAFRALHPEMAGRETFLFLFLELEPPYAVTPVKLNGTFRALGEMRWRRAVNRWAWSLKHNRWDSYVDGVTEIEPPRWGLDREMEVTA